MDKKTVRNMLGNAEIEDLFDIISRMSVFSQDAERVITDWCKKNNTKYQKKAAEIELENLWAKAQKVIDEFNDYGGGPECEEEEACDCLWEMDEIVKEQSISWKVRKSILDEMLEQFRRGNSGFDDLLIDIGESFCKNTEEKRYLADVLA